MEARRMWRGDGRWRWRRGREEEGAIELSRADRPTDRGCGAQGAGGWLAPSFSCPQQLWTSRKLDAFITYKCACFGCCWLLWAPDCGLSRSRYTFCAKTFLFMLIVLT